VLPQCHESLALNLNEMREFNGIFRCISHLAECFGVRGEREGNGRYLEPVIPASEHLRLQSLM
jgi:hypothetical protein